MLSLEDAVGMTARRAVDLVALDEALHGLARLDPKKSQLVELRFFGGLTIEEAAAVLNVSPATLKREWASAKAWLHRELQRGSGGHA